MRVEIEVNGVWVKEEAEAGMTLYQFLRDHNCASVKCGCETANCGLCTVFMNEKPVLSCAVLIGRANKARITTLEGLQKEAEELGAFVADQGAEQCGLCNPGFLMNTIALFREIPSPTKEEIKEYLSGNLCRCSGYEGQMRAILTYLGKKEEGKG